MSVWICVFPHIYDFCSFASAVFSVYLLILSLLLSLLSLLLLLLVCFIMRESKKGCGLVYIRRWGGSGKNWRRRNFIGNILFGKYLFLVKRKENRKRGSPRKFIRIRRDFSMCVCGREGVCMYDKRTRINLFQVLKGNNY